HFSAWDCNWSIGPPDAAELPRQQPPHVDKPVADRCKTGGSIIECENQVLRESLGIVGTPFRLHYASNRVAGHKITTALHIPLSGPTMPPDASGIALEITIAGQRFTRSFASAPNQNYTFAWDGRDAYNQTLQGAQPVTVQVGYVYPAVYQQPSNARSFGLFSGIPITGDRARREVTLWQIWQGSLERFDARPQGLAAWTLDVQHTYDPAGKILYEGN